VLRYPDWLSVVDQAVIDQALSAVEPQFRPIPESSAGLIILKKFADEGSALVACLRVCDVVVARLQDPQYGDRDAARTAAADLRDQIIVWANRFRPSRVIPLEIFADTVRQAVAREAWWIALQAEPGRRTPATASSKRALAAWLKQEMTVRDVTPHRLMKVYEGPNEKTTRKILDGHGTSREDVKQKLVDALNAADRTRRPITLRDLPQK
jgi:hypothetical protein